MSRENDERISIDEALQDGVIIETTLRNLSDNLQKEDEEEKVLNGPLSMVCTYPEGYVERQSLYSCLTCQQETGQLAGICFACSENCHQDHDLIQLHTKRNFCCDCGNSKFKGKCKLFEEKSTVNRKNKYDHNFKGEYCTCKKPYPPPEDDPLYQAEMFQCTMCEDWFHDIHIGMEKITPENFSELICPSCSVEFPFLIPYHYVYEQDAKRADQTNLDSTAADSTINAGPNASNLDLNATGTSFHQSEPSLLGTPKRPPVDNTITEDPTECYYEKIKSIVPDSATPRALVFYDIDWRPMLCRCVNCKRMYEDLGCEFLLDENDPVYQYLTKNAKEMEKNRRDPQTELFEEVALRTNPDVAHNVVAEIATFKNQLHSFFTEMSKKEGDVTLEDVHEFFDGLKAKRRRLHDPADEDKQI